MMELNREQIIKAFECCTLNACNCTGGCPYRGTSGKWTGEECWRKARNDLYILINELTEENETLRGLYEHNSQLAIDSERKLAQCKKSYEDELNRAHMLLSMAWESVEAKDQLLGTIKADTVREMGERLKEYLDDFYNSGEDAFLDVPDLIDDIAKEVLED